MATSDAGRIEVWAGSDETGGSDTLHYAGSSGASQRIRYEQVAFMELQSGYNAQLLQWSARFYAVESGNGEAAAEWADEGWITRVWSFSESDLADAIPSFPATDTPFDDWYQTLCSDEAAVE